MNTAFRSCARTFTIFATWRRTKTWPSRFYKIGDAADLAEQLIAILAVSGAATQMAEHNFAAGLEMTMTSVVRNYLRWFELNKYRGAMGGRRREWLPAPSSRTAWWLGPARGAVPHPSRSKTDTTLFDGHKYK